MSKQEKLTIVPTMQKLLFILLFINFNLLSQTSLAQGFASMDGRNIILCPGGAALPSFTEADCHQVNQGQVNPQNKAVWIKTNIQVSEDFLHSSDAFALFLLGKMSSEVYFNGQLLGSNGVPAVAANDELVGKMDAKLFVPKTLIKLGDNELVIFMSAHHGFFDLSYPLHFIGLGEFSKVNDIYQHNLWFSLPLLGVLLLGAVYFFTLSFYTEKPKNTVLFLFMALFAAAQLLAEMSRGLFNYTYPFHDIRLLAIVSFAACFGTCLLLFTLGKFADKHKFIWLMFGLISMLLGIILTPGFDSKTALAIFIPAVTALLLLATRYWQKRTKSTLVYMLVFASFILTIILNFSSFHNLPYYYIITAMMCYLFIRQANELAWEKAKRKLEEKQVDRLLFRLEQKKQQLSPPKLKISSAGKIELLSTDDISFCKASGDYVEIYLEDKTCHLYSGSLKLLETLLPTTFLKVHRSYIVNLDHVIGLKSSAVIDKEQGLTSGVLHLKSEEWVPVSRRIMPLVRGRVDLY
jgi:hypothetical protein